MQGIYDYRGECFGYIVDNKLYDLEDRHYGYLTPTAITSLEGNLIWHRDRDGVYDRHWVSIGYIGQSLRAGNNDH